MAASQNKLVGTSKHKSVSFQKVEEKLLNTEEQLIEEGADTFYLGGYGAFDRLAHQTVKKLQRTHTGLINSAQDVLT